MQTKFSCCHIRIQLHHKLICIVRYAAQHSESGLYRYTRCAVNVCFVETSNNQCKQSVRNNNVHLLLSRYIAAGCANFACIDLCCKSERAQGLISSFWHRRHVNKHERLGITTQAGLQQVCELGVAVGNMSLLVGKCHDHVTCSAIATYGWQLLL